MAAAWHAYWSTPVTSTSRLRAKRRWPMPDPVLVVDGLRKEFPGQRSLTDLLTRTPARDVTAVDGVSFQVMPGEVLALVGESGCGKTTTGNLLLGLMPPTAGKVVFQGQHVGGLSHRELLRLR